MRQRWTLYRISIIVICLIVITGGGIWKRVGWKEIECDGYGVEYEGNLFNTSDFVVMDADTWTPRLCKFKNECNCRIILFDAEKGFIFLESGEAIEAQYVHGFLIERKEERSGEIGNLVVELQGQTTRYQIAEFAERFWYKIQS